MANAFFNLTLDTLAPSISSFTINSGASVTTSAEVALQIVCSATDVTSMKIWGISGAANEADASWETFANTKTVTLPSTSHGLYTIHIKLRDDVYNESSETTASITLSTELPAIVVTGPDVSKISEVTGKDTCSFSFTSSVALKAWKVKLVPATNSNEGAGTQINTTNGSIGMSGAALAASTAQSCTIDGSDLKAACGSTDGTYIIKVFGQNAENDLWSA